MSKTHVLYRLNDLLTIPELALKLKVKVRTVREWIQRRKIPFTRFQRRVYIDAGIVEKLLARNAVYALCRPPSPTLLEQGGEQTIGGNS